MSGNTEDRHPDLIIITFNPKCLSAILYFNVNIIPLNTNPKRNPRPLKII